MDYTTRCILTAMLVLRFAIAGVPICPKDPNCECTEEESVELSCNINDRKLYIHLLPNIYVNIRCEEIKALDYNTLPKFANINTTFQSVILKDCPLPLSSFKDALSAIGVSKTSALIFQNGNKLAGSLERRYFAGLQGLTKLLLSINGIILSDTVFKDIKNLKWLHINAKDISISNEIFKPLAKLATLEVSHSQMTNISSEIFSHLTFLKKLSLWQNNVTKIPEDFFLELNILEELELSSNDLIELPTNIFRPLRKLKKLTLFSNTFLSLSMNMFQSNTELESVIILNNNVKLKQIPGLLFGNLPKLKQISIHKCGIEIMPYDVFKNSTSLTDLSLANNDVTVITESIFNDQINLLELDLSNNKIKKLERKIFSSLLRLERLNLGFNLLELISGTTFAPLLSLIYLNIEHNRLKTISSYMFINNKQKMIITLAYNELNFKTIRLRNNSWVNKNISPFSHTYNLKLLNLSHNNFQGSSLDWWFNGHDIVDLKYNSIKDLWINDVPDVIYNTHQSVQKSIKRKSRKIWISNNPITCSSKNKRFIEFLHANLNLKIMDLEVLPCIMWITQSYTYQSILYFFIAIILAFGIIISITLCTVFRKTMFLLVKKLIGRFSKVKNAKAKCHYLYLNYSKSDEQFVLEEILPGFKYQKQFDIQTYLICTDNNSLKHTNNLPDEVKSKSKSIIIFSSNYLTSIYDDIKIEEIHRKVADTKDVVYVFVDTGPANSLYTFLKEQRNKRTTALWGELDFWNTFFKILFDGDGAKQTKKQEANLLCENTPKFPNSNLVLRLTDH